MKTSSQVLIMAVMLSGVAMAQEFPRFAFDLGAGFTTPSGKAGSRLDYGWNAAAGAGVRFHPYVGLKMDFNYSSFGVNTSTLNALGFPGGNARMWSLTLNPVIHTNPRGPVDVYFTGGGGLFHWNQDFTAPSATTVTVFDPYFGYYYNAAIPVTQVLSSYSVYKPGWDAGAGIAFGGLKYGKFFSEARFQRMVFGNDRYVDTLPVTFGFRW